MTFTRRAIITTLAGSTAGLALIHLGGCTGARTDKPLLTQNIARMARDIFPHVKVPDSAYARIIDGMMMAASPTQILALEEGMNALSGKGSVPWHRRPEADRIGNLKEIETTPFFIGVRMATLFGLYGNPAIVKTFGYPGPSVDFGGYISAGFNDLKWLPEPRT